MSTRILTGLPGNSEKQMRQEELAAEIRRIGFSCTRCGECCRETNTDSNLVMLYPPERAELCTATGREGEEFSEPYPEAVAMPGGGSIRFERCIRRREGVCIFLDGNRCQVYASRPWICRTYPFMLSGEDLMVFPCRGIGGTLSEGAAWEIAGRLLARNLAEKEEEERVRTLLSSNRIPAGAEVLIDGTGMRIL